MCIKNHTRVPKYSGSVHVKLNHFYVPIIFKRAPNTRRIDLTKSRLYGNFKSCKVFEYKCLYVRYLSQKRRSFRNTFGIRFKLFATYFKYTRETILRRRTFSKCIRCSNYTGDSIETPVTDFGSILNAGKTETNNPNNKCRSRKNQNRL